MNALLTPDRICAEFLRLVLPELKDWGEMQYAQQAGRRGHTVILRRTLPFCPQVFGGIAPQITETHEPVVLNLIIPVPLDICDQDLTMSIDRFSDRVLRSRALIFTHHIKGRWALGSVMVACDMDLPSGLRWAHRCSDGKSFSLRLVRDWDIVTDGFLTQVDALIGFSKSPVKQIGIDPGKAQALLKKRDQLEARLLALRARRAAQTRWL